MYLKDAPLIGTTAANAYRNSIEAVHDWLRGQCAQENDFALVTGAPGSGKSSVLAALLEELSKDSDYVALAPFSATWVSPNVNSIASLVAHLEGSHQSPPTAVRAVGAAHSGLWSLIADYSDPKGAKHVERELSSSPDNFRERTARREKLQAQLPLQLRQAVHAWLDKAGATFLGGRKQKPQFVLCVDDLDFAQSRAWDLLQALQFLRHPLLSVIVFADNNLLQSGVKNGVLRENEHMTANTADMLAQEYLRRWFPARFEIPTLSPEQRRETLAMWGMPTEFWELWNNANGNSAVVQLNPILPDTYRQLKQLHNWTMRQIVPQSPSTQTNNERLWQVRRSFLAEAIAIQFAPMVTSSDVQRLFYGLSLSPQRTDEMIACLSTRATPTQLLRMAQLLEWLTDVVNFLRR